MKLYIHIKYSPLSGALKSGFHSFFYTKLLGLFKFTLLVNLHSDNNIKSRNINNVKIIQDSLAVAHLVEKTACKCSVASSIALIRIFVKVLIETCKYKQ